MVSHGRNKNPAHAHFNDVLGILSVPSVFSSRCALFKRNTFVLRGLIDNGESDIHGMSFNLRSGGILAALIRPLLLRRWNLLYLNLISSYIFWLRNLFGLKFFHTYVPEG